MNRAITSKDFLALVQGKAPKESRANKFNAVRVGDFDSKHEASWVGRLMDLQTAGYIGNLRVDKRELMFPLDVNFVRICQYEADAQFDVLQDFEMPTFGGPVLLRTGEHRVLDAKSIITRKRREYVLKRNLMFALYGIKILEV